MCFNSTQTKLIGVQYNFGYWYLKKKQSNLIKPQEMYFILYYIVVATINSVHKGKEIGKTLYLCVVYST